MENVSCPLTIHPSWCNGGCGVTLARDLELLLACYERVLQIYDVLRCSFLVHGKHPMAVITYDLLAPHSTS